MVVSQSSMLPNSLLVTMLGAWWDQLGASVPPCSVGVTAQPRGAEALLGPRPFATGPGSSLCAHRLPLSSPSLASAQFSSSLFSDSSSGFILTTHSWP